MAKSQKRTGREAKKPKTVKAPTAATASLTMKGSLEPLPPSKKK